MSNNKIQDFLKALGLTQEDIKGLTDEQGQADGKEVAKRVADAIKERVKEDELPSLTKQAKADALKEAQIAAYERTEKALAQTFGLDIAAYKDLTKGRFEKMLEDAKASIETSSKSQEDASKSLSELSEYKAKLETANKELKRLQELEKTMPTALESAKKEVYKEYHRKEIVREALKKVRPKISELIDDETLELRLLNMVMLDVAETETGEFSVSIKDKTGKPLSKSHTEIYKNLDEVLLEKVVPNTWIKQQATPPSDLPKAGNNPQQPPATPNPKHSKSGVSPAVWAMLNKDAPK